METNAELIKKSVDGLKALATLAERTSRALEDYDVSALLKMVPKIQKSLFEDESSTQKPTFKELQEILREKERKGYVNEVHTVLLRYGAKSLSDIKPKKYARFKKDIEEYCRDIPKGEILQAAQRILDNRMYEELKELLLFNGATSIDNLPKSRYASFLFEARRM